MRIPLGAQADLVDAGSPRPRCRRISALTNRLAVLTIRPDRTEHDTSACGGVSCPSDLDDIGTATF